MDRPLGITILATLASINGLAASAFGIATLLGNRFLFTQSGYGPSRIPPASLLGPFAGYAGWALLFIGLIMTVLSYGLFTLRPWSRLVILGLLALAGLLTVVALGWGAWNAQWGVIGAGGAKLILYCALGWYMRLPVVRAAFSASRPEHR